MRNEQKVSPRGRRSSRTPFVRLGDIGEFLRGKGIPRSDLSDEGIPCLRYGEIYSSYDNTVAYLKSRVAPEAAAAATVLKTRDIVFTDASETLEEIAKAVAYIGPEPAYVGDHTIIFREHRQDPAFLAHALNSEHARKQKSRLGKGQSIVMISASDLSNVEILLLPLTEQRKVAKIFETWDGALENLRSLRMAKERRLGALRSSLLFCKLRLGVSNRKWTPTRLSDVTHELNARNGSNGLIREHVMGISKTRGVVPMRKQMIPNDISRYKRLSSRAFAYIPWSIGVGSFAMNKRNREVLISPDYIAFACNADGLDPDYLSHVCMTSWWAHYTSSRGSGSVRQRTYYRDLATLKVPLPELKEQKAIAAVLNTARHDLALTEREIDAVTLQKRGLMQKLLTGEWRVNSRRVSA